MYLLDTNVLSELRTGKPHPDAHVLSWRPVCLWRPST